MLRVRQNEDEIIIRELPVFKWLKALIATVTVFIFTIIAVSSVDGISNLFWIFCVLAPLVAFLLYLLTYPTVTTKINIQGQTVSVRKKSLLGYSFNVYSFSEINEQIYVDVQNGIPGEKIYQLKMPLKNGQVVELSINDGSKKSQYFDAAQLMNPYISGLSRQISAKTVFTED